MSNSQQQASRRNYLKMRLVGMDFRATTTKPNVVTAQELIILQEIDDLKMKLLEQWEESSMELGFNLSRRGTRKYTSYEQNL